MTLAWPQNEPFVQYSDLGQCYFWLLIVKNIRKISFNFIIVTNRPNHEQLTSVSSCQNFGLIEPAMNGKISIFGQLFYFLGSLEGVVLNFV